MNKKKPKKITVKVLGRSGKWITAKADTVSEATARAIVKAQRT